MIRVENIVYAPHDDRRGAGDLYLPDEIVGAPLALVIHGGGWNAMDRRGLAGVAAFLAEQGWAAYNVNYRLIDHAPWPACGDDCLAAAEFAERVEHEFFAMLDRRRLLVIGASAGGHLALMTGLRLPPQRVAGIVSIAGPTDLELSRQDGRLGDDFWRRFFDCDGEIAPGQFHAASPMSFVSDNSPPLLLLHSTRDKLVDIEHSRRIARAYARHGRRAELFEFEGNDENHGIWVPDSRPHRLLPELEAAIAAFLPTLCGAPEA